MHIPGTEPSSVILSQTKLFQKLKIDAQKCQNKLKPKGMASCTKLQFQLILTRQIVLLSKRYESTEVDRRTYIRLDFGYGPILFQKCHSYNTSG